VIRAAPIATERSDLQFGDIAVSMIRVAELAPHVDRDQLLGSSDVDEPPYWMHLWPGAHALARRIASGPGLRGWSVLELGCGMALPALVAARRGASVVATDRQHAPLLMAAESATLNRVDVAVVQMDWRRTALRRNFDLVLGADVAYDAGDEEALAAAIDASTGPGGRFLLADSVNTYRQGLAGRLRRGGFDVSETPSDERDDGRVVWVRCLEGVRR
jgi:predicted nicotinamide N-methyase